MSSDIYTRINWHITNIVLPMVPFLVGGAIRYNNAHCTLSLNTFSASDLAICLAFLSLDIHQSILKKERPLNNEDKEQEAASHANLFLLFAIISLLLFGANVNYCSLDPCLVKQPLINSEYATFAFTPIVLVFSNMAQKTFRLKAAI